MKKIGIILMIICFIPAFGFADEVDEGLPSDTPARVKESARQIIGLGVESQDVIKMTKTMIENRYTEQNILAAHEVLKNAENQNLAMEPIINKLHEGVAKRIKAEQTIQAMDTVRSRYQTASSFAAKITQDREQVRSIAQEMAECMTAGMGNGDMDRITTMLRQRTKDMKTEEARVFNKDALGAIRLMARTGADSGSVTEVFSNAFHENYTAREMEKLGNAFLRQAKGSSAASDLAKSYSDAIRNGAKADDVVNFGQNDFWDDGSNSGVGKGSSVAGSHGNIGVSGGSGKGNSGGSKGK